MDKGASLRDRATHEPSRAVSAVPVAIPSAGQIYRSELYAMTVVDTGRAPDGSPLAEVWTFASEDDYVVGHGWLEVRVHEVVATASSGVLAVYYRQWFSPEGEPAWCARPKRTVGSLASLKSLIRRRKMTAQGIEAREGGDACGSIADESPVGTADAPNPFPPTPPSKTEGHTISVGVTDEGGSHD